MNTFVLVVIYRKVAQLANVPEPDEDSFDDVSPPSTPLPLLQEEEEEDDDDKSVPVTMLSNNYIRRSLLMSDQSLSSPDIASSNVYDEITNVMVPKRFLQTSAFVNYRQGSKKRKRLAATSGIGATTSRGASSKSFPASATHTARCPTQTLTDFILPIDNSTRKTIADVTMKPIENILKPETSVETIAHGDDPKRTYMNMDKLSPSEERVSSDDEINDLNSMDYIPMNSIPRLSKHVHIKSSKSSNEVVESTRLSKTMDLSPGKIAATAASSRVSVTSKIVSSTSQKVSATSKRASSKPNIMAALTTGPAMTSSASTHIVPLNNDDHTVNVLEERAGNDEADVRLTSSCQGMDETCSVSKGSSPSLVMSQDIKNTKDSIERILDRQCVLVPCLLSNQQNDHALFQDDIS
jgi:hypothetical protein